jgi:predicted phage tail protein
MINRFLSVGYASMVVSGLLALVLPKQAIKLNGKLLLRGYENPGDLEPKEWYVRSTRISGLGMLVTGVAGLLAGQRTEDDDGEAPTEQADEFDGSDDEPVELDV